MLRVRITDALNEQRLGKERRRPCFIGGTVDQHPAAGRIAEGARNAHLMFVEFEHFFTGYPSRNTFG
jgi:hypothetical protein